jgi:hypothetical protein
VQVKMKVAFRVKDSFCGSLPHQRKDSDERSFVTNAGSEP